MKTQTRREFLKTAGGTIAAAALLRTLPSCSVFSAGNAVAEAEGSNVSVPSYLSGYGDLYRKNPHEAALKWFREAKFGFGLHYALGSFTCEGMGKDPNNPLTGYQYT